MIEGMLGRKMGMIQLFDQAGHMRAATVIEAGPCLVTQIKTEETDGYRAIQLGFGTAKHINKPTRGHLGRQGDLRYLREFGVDEPDQHRVGERVGVEIFHEGDQVDVTGISKGRGFAGAVKRHGFAGGPKTHGQSDRHRARGSIGDGGQGRVFKGMRMAGHMGAERVTVRNLEVLQSNPARGILLVSGAVPGARNGLVRIRYSLHTLPAVRARKPQAVEEPAPADADVEEQTAGAEQEAPSAAAEESTAAAEAPQAAEETDEQAQESDAAAAGEAAKEDEADEKKS